MSKELSNETVAMISLATGNAANHLAMGQCQLQRLRGYGLPEEQIAAAIEIARHIRDEAAAKRDLAFDEKASTALAAIAGVPGPLVDAQWLAAHKGDVLILDVRKNTKSFATSMPTKMGVGQPSCPILPCCEIPATRSSPYMTIEGIAHSAVEPGR